MKENLKIGHKLGESIDKSPIWERLSSWKVHLCRKNVHNSENMVLYETVKRAVQSHHYAGCIEDK